MYSALTDHTEGTIVNMDPKYYTIIITGVRPEDEQALASELRCY